MSASGTRGSGRTGRARGADGTRSSGAADTVGAVGPVLAVLRLGSDAAPRRHLAVLHLRADLLALRRLGRRLRGSSTSPDDPTDEQRGYSDHEDRDHRANTHLRILLWLALLPLPSQNDGSMGVSVQAAPRKKPPEEGRWRRCSHRDRTGGPAGASPPLPMCCYADTQVALAVTVPEVFVLVWLATVTDHWVALILCMSVTLTFRSVLFT